MLIEKILLPQPLKGLQRLEPVLRYSARIIPPNNRFKHGLVPKDVVQAVHPEVLGIKLVKGRSQLHSQFR